MRNKVIFIVLFIVVVFAYPTGCASSLRSQYADVERIVQERTGQRIVWREEFPSDAAMSETIRPLLSQPLTVSAATQIALINNHSLNATLMEITMARADLVQAGLPNNPQTFSRYRSVISGSSGYDYEFQVLAQNAMHLVTMPLRRRLAKFQLDQTKAQAAHAALNLACQVKIAFYTLQGQLQACNQQLGLIQEMESVIELSRRQRLIGELNEQDLLKQEHALSQARQNLEQQKLRIMIDREALNRLMGLSGSLATGWSLDGDLSQPLPGEPSCESLEAQSLGSRMDLAVARVEIAMLQEALKLQRMTSWVPLLHLGVDYERNTSKTKVIGPFIIFELPIFDWGQARIARAKAMLEQSKQRMAGLEINTRSEVRAAYERLMTARKTVQSYRDEILPQMQKLTSLAQERSSCGDNWLKARQDEVTARLEVIDALRDYWIAQVGIAQALEGIETITSERKDDSASRRQIIRFAPPER